jgi:MFS family permease
LIGSTFFFSSIIGVTIFPRLADIYGRKRIFLGGLFAHTILLSILLLMKSLNTAYILVFLYGLAEAAKDYAGIVYMLELVPTKS